MPWPAEPPGGIWGLAQTQKLQLQFLKKNFIFFMESSCIPVGLRQTSRLARPELLLMPRNNHEEEEEGKSEITV